MIEAPLEGVTVLDLGQVYQGPYAGFLMARAGADVIKVEPPTGDSVRKRPGETGYTFSALNAGKQSVVLDLKSSHGVALLHRLVEHADILLENFVPGTMERLGCSPGKLLEINPRLIYASGSGFGRTGPARRKPAMDLTIQAAAGVLSLTGEPDGVPTRAGPAVADFIAGIHMYGAAVSGLLARSRTGRGGVVEVAMIEALVPTLLSSMAWMFERDVTRPPRTHNHHSGEAVAPHNVYPTRDGWVAILCLTDDQWARLTKAMDSPDLSSRPGLATTAERIRNQDELDEIVAAWTRSHSADEVSHLCEENRVPASPVREIRDVMSDAGMRERGFLYDVARPGGGTSTFFNSPLRFAESTPQPPFPAPRLGQHTEEVLETLLHLGTDEVNELRSRGAFGRP
ncbi:CaiB/BaiF CoA transferase family protein [Rhodococcus sp. T2V]|uniref:CaiB/BaiF CoA transferase family protein n=1 Tax=Rhodococcus sp. T2V TaxID=3034164 RepID=UPI0023E138DE|nr:CoA transferase [Rhodococcus sp. T2V]MDF3304471.1 CoA transferase [Rhodococcus sp. T2V]